ncbi:MULTISPECIES: 6-carboxytetrahydropterin synthase [Bacillaceae]|uniref:6-carboxy-5,6,7,8-tetrahydropterin synthase n=1 Tax=Pseudobacillus wudalianchiensis TaxID=1743143 RepID=A0A1B9AC59_9BACI|nr:MULTISPECIES: 6-pyruvoyl tetrahydropterin synthase family protein [Bacillus]KMY55152.1 6-carboxy-5,6,7,8-tetrahydropterin synthase [Bacillus sp. FJAT-27231]OCA81401.1 6-carboxytetrahydropterin synthase QueD [Bacillus wudalianchiensis]
MIQQIYPVPMHSYRYELNKDFQFAAAHYVPHEAAGACRRLHGHTYFANVTVVGNDLNESGFLVNFQDIKNLIHKRFDHTILNEDSLFNEMDPNDFPTTEVVARKFWEVIQESLNKLPNKPLCIQVFLRETPTSYVVFRPQKEDFQ